MPDAQNQSTSPVSGSGVLAGRRTYIAIATVLVGVVLKRYAAHLPAGVQDMAGPLIDEVADILTFGGAAAAAWFRRIAKV